MRSGGCVPLSLRVCVDEIFGRNTWDALSRRYEDLCGNQPVGRVQFFTKSLLGDDAAVLAPSSDEEPTPPRHRAGAASMAWRTTR